MTSAADATTRLLRIARRKADEGRRQLRAICGDLLSGGGAALAGVEYALVRDILARLIEAFSAPLRRNLSEQLSVIAPERADAASALVTDEVNFTHPLLLGVEAVIDLELLETIRHRALEHRLMLAMRRTQPDPDDTAGADPIGSLLRNEDPALREAAMAYLVQQSRRFDAFLEPVVLPEELAPALRRKLTIWLLAVLRHHLQERYEIDQTRLDDAMEAVATAASRLPDGPPDDAGLALARRLNDSGLITAQLLLQVLRQGEVALFVALLAELGGLRRELAGRLIFEPGADGLAVLCRAVGLGRSVLASIYLLTRRARPTQHASTPGELTQVLALYDGTEPGAAREVLARWRRDRDFLTALRFVEEAATGGQDEDWRQLLLAPTSSGHADLARNV